MQKNGYYYSHPLDGSSGVGIRIRSHVPYYFNGAHHYVYYDKGRLHHFYIKKPVTEDSIKIYRWIFRIALALFICVYALLLLVVFFVLPREILIYCIIGFILHGALCSIPLWVEYSRLKKDEKAYYLPGDRFMYPQGPCDHCGGEYIYGIHNACPHCGAALQ